MTRGWKRHPHMRDVFGQRRVRRVHTWWLGLALCGLAGIGGPETGSGAPPSGHVEASAIVASTWTSPLAPLTSPNSGSHCASGLGADDLSALFANGVGSFEGADYQRAIRLPDDRVLWTFQDAFINGRLTHNAAMVQSGRCFTLLNKGEHEFVLGDRTIPMSRWHWILGGEISRNGTRIHLFVVEMDETGDHYLAAPRPDVVRRVVLDAQTFAVVRVVNLPRTGLDLYGWSVTSDQDHTYLYSHCYRQFGFDTLFGFHPCSEFVKVARVPRGQFNDPPRYWNGSRWVLDHRAAVPVVDGSFVFSGNNPAQISFDGEVFALVEKRDDWWGTTVEFGVAQSPQGPFRRVAGRAEPLLCDRERCNTYFAAWVPWTHNGHRIWSISHNYWSASASATASESEPETTPTPTPKGRNLAMIAPLDVRTYPTELYRPTFHTVDLPSCSGRTATIVGTFGPDRIVGTPSSDVIVAFGGDDTVRGRGGDDVLCLGPGNDVAEGGSGDDIMYGRSGRDVLVGGGGADILHGEGGADRLDGGRGNDVVHGGPNSDTVRGGPRGDILYGGRGKDTILGEEGNDTLHGGPLGDVLRGGDGNDTIYGKGGNDTLYGGDLDDHLDGGRDIDLCRGHRGTDTAVRCETTYGIP